MVPRFTMLRITAFLLLVFKFSFSIVAIIHGPQVMETECDCRSIPKGPPDIFTRDCEAAFRLMPRTGYVVIDPNFMQQMHAGAEKPLSLDLRNKNKIVRGVK